MLHSAFMMHVTGKSKKDPLWIKLLVVQPTDNQIISNETISANSIVENEEQSNLLGQTFTEP